MDQETYKNRVEFGIQKALEEAVMCHNIKRPKMSRKRFKKLMMSHGVTRDLSEAFCNAIGQGDSGSYFDFYIWLQSRRNIGTLSFFLDDYVKIEGDPECSG